MNSSHHTHSDSLFAGINVTPLVDITLVLLIIFMVTARLITSQTLPLDLPKAATGAEQQVVFAIALEHSGVTLVDGSRIDADDQIARLARAARDKQPDVRAVIQADGAVPHSRVVRTMDLLRQGGIGKVAFAITPDVTESATKE